MIERVLNTIKKHNLIKDGESIVVGVSGGPDSICLLHALKTISENMDLKLYAVHVNHTLRGSESDADEDYVKEFCKKFGITLFTVALDIKGIAVNRAVSIEEAGRDARYEQFKIFADKVNASKIAVAHNKNDQSETVLMNIIRGAGLNGIKGIEYKRGDIIRPLLDIERTEIERYCIENSLNPRIDSSNSKTIYTRNKIRLELIPYIDKMFETNISNSIYRLASLVRDDINFIESKAADLYEECIIESEKEEVWLNLDKLKSYHSAIIGRIVRNAVRTVKGNLKGLESKHVESVIDLGLHGRTGSIICLTDNVRAEKSYNTLKFYKLKSNEPFKYFEMSISIPGKNFIENSKSYIEADIFEKQQDYREFINISFDSPEQFFDYEKLKSGIYIRYRKEGDVFKPIKSNGTKKLKEYFIDNKIPKNSRDKIPLIAKDNEIIWIIGYKISDKFKVTENTKYILKLKYKQFKITNSIP